MPDRVADRIADTAFALVIWRCGAPWRTRLTVAERPTRVICTVLAALCAAVAAAHLPATVCSAVWCGLTLIAFAQLTGRPRQRN